MRIAKGANLQGAHGGGRDPQAMYAEHYLLGMFWPYDENAKLLVEHVYQLEPAKAVKLADDEVITLEQRMAVAAELCASHGRRRPGRRADPSRFTDKDVARVVATTVETCGRIDVLINNAGHGDPMLVPDMSADGWDGMLTTNLRSAFLMSRAVWQPFIDQGGGAIVNASSITGHCAMFGLAAYGAAEAWSP